MFVQLVVIRFYALKQKNVVAQGAPYGGSLRFAPPPFPPPFFCFFFEEKTKKGQFFGEKRRTFFAGWLVGWLMWLVVLSAPPQGVSNRLPLARGLIHPQGSIVCVLPT